MNYDIKSNYFLNWYQQLVAESLGKKKFGIFPIISSMPKDNHSLMQLYLDGPKNNFLSFFDALVEQPIPWSLQENDCFSFRKFGLFAVVMQK